MSADFRVQPRSDLNRFGERFESWKQIAAYLDRHITTVRRWEKQESLPVHRHAHSKLDSVYAYSAELDVWIESRKPDLSGTPSPNATLGAPAHFRSLPPPPSLSGLPPWPVGLPGARTGNRAPYKARPEFLSGWTMGIGKS